MKTLADFKFESVDPAKILEIIKQYPDILTPASKAQQAKLQGQTCPYCHKPLQLVLHPHPFVANRPLPRFVGRCDTCKVSGILIET